MPAFLQSFIEAEQERSRRIEQLRKEIREFAKEEAGSSITEQILLFLADEMVEHLSEIDYELRMKFELYITPLIKRNYIYRYTGTFDRILFLFIFCQSPILPGIYLPLSFKKSTSKSTASTSDTQTSCTRRHRHSSAEK